MGTLNIAGTASAPIDVTLSQVAGVTGLNTINITNANVTLQGVLNIGALANYQIGSGGKLTINSTLSVVAGSRVTFTAPNSTLVLKSGLNLGLLSGITGFASGSTIDVSAIAASVAYTDNAGTNTGGTLTLLSAGGLPVATLPLTTGEYVAGDFRLSSDGATGTLINLGIVATGVTASPGAAQLGVGSSVAISVTTSAPVTVSGGTPTLTLSDGGSAIFDPTASSGSTLVFRHTVAAGQNTPDLAVVGVSLNGATLSDPGGVAVDLSAAIANPAGVLQIDTTAPTVTAVTTNPAGGTLSAGETVTIGVMTSEGVGVTGGTPTLTLNDGGIATYDPGASTSTMLMFTNMVMPGQNTSNLAVTGVNLNGASISDPAGNVADLSGAIINPTGSGNLAVGGGSAAGTSTGDNVLGVYRFFDSTTGTHFFTGSTAERDALLNTGSSSYRADLKAETNNFGAIDPNASDPNAVTVYRFFDTSHGTHFFTASQAEANALNDKNSSLYRNDLVFEPSSGFLEHSTQQAGDVAVYRFFDTRFGTHFYTGSQSEYAAIVTPGTAGYRADLVSEGVGFYAPSGTFS